MDIHLRENLCLRNSGRNCHPVEHFKLSCRRAQVTVCVCRDSVVPPLSGLSGRVSLFFFLTESCYVQALLPHLPSLHPKDYGKMPLPRTKVHVAIKKKSATQNTCDNLSAVTAAEQQLPQRLWTLPQLVFYLIDLPVALLQFQLGHLLSLPWSFTCS